MVRSGAFSLHSLSARGAIAKTHIYWVQNGIQQRKPYKVPANPQTGPQQANRNKFAMNIMLWQLFPPANKATYNALAREMNLRMSGFNLFLRERMLA